MLRNKIHKIFKPITILVIVSIVSGVGASIASPVYAGTECGGSPNKPVPTAIDFGCTGKGNPISDLAFALIRLLADGVGIVVIGSIIVGGIQFSASRGDPQATSAAIGRIRSSVLALIIYIFAFAILNYLIPGGFFNNSSTIQQPLTVWQQRVLG
jgi:hypothetical protein